MTWRLRDIGNNIFFISIFGEKYRILFLVIIILGIVVLDVRSFIIRMDISEFLFRYFKILYFWQDNSATLLTNHLRAYTIIYIVPLMSRFFFKAQAIIVTVTSQDFIIIWAACPLCSSLKEMSLKSMSDWYFPKNKEENLHLSWSHL